jgi:cyclopropane-fatty-acyl-phospholipid synthase
VDLTIISVGAFEHFARPELTFLERLEAYRRFFSSCYEWLKPGGFLSLQTMGLEDVDDRLLAAMKRNSTSFVPESSAPFAEELVLAASEWFAIRRLRCDGNQYARTMHEWVERLQGARNLICERYGRNMYMRFRRTLKTAEILFSRNQLTLYRVEFVKQRNTRIPGIFQELKESGALAAEFA